MAASAKQLALLVFPMTFHAGYIIAIMHIIMGILPFFILRVGCRFNQFFPVVTIQTGKVWWKS